MADRIASLREWLEANGWRTGLNHMRHECNECDWYAYRRTALQARECELNDGKAMQVVLTPFAFMLNGARSKSVTMDVTGEYGGQWFKLQAYGLDLGRLPESLPAIEASLIAAWNALEVSHG